MVQAGQRRLAPSVGVGARLFCRRRRTSLLVELGYSPISTQGLGVCAEKVRRPKTASGP